MKFGQKSFAPPKNLPAPTPMMLGAVDKIRLTYYNNVDMGARSSCSLRLYWAKVGVQESVNINFN